MSANSKFFISPNNSNNSNQRKFITIYVEVTSMDADPTRGYAGVGKTRLINRIAKDEYTNKIYDPEHMLYQVSPDITLFFRDDSPADRERRADHAVIMRPMTIVLMCYDVTDKESFTYISRNIGSICDDPKYHQNTRFVLVATKCDVPEMERQVKSAEGKALVESLRGDGVDYIETSAKTGVGCKELVDVIIRPVPVPAIQPESSCTIS